MDSSVRNHGDTEYDKQNWLQRQKIRSMDNLPLPRYINRSITKNFPIETLLEMMDSSVKSLGEVEYDNQNCLKHQKNPVCRKVRSEVYVLLLLYINRSITKKFPIETLLEMIDSNVKSPGKF